MSVLEQIGCDAVSGRNLFVRDAAQPDDILAEFDVQAPFVCLLAWDAATVAALEISKVASRLLAAGCVHICAWGSDCSRVHDIFDEADLARAPDGPWVTSTWHDDESVDEAISFLLFNAHPNPDRYGDCRSAVGISIGTPDWAAMMRAAMRDPGSFSARMVGDE